MMAAKMGHMRTVVCPMCGESSPITSLEDDTRHRYGRHTNVVAQSCEMSGELIVPETTEVESWPES
jgi:hypothetical protein